MFEADLQQDDQAIATGEPVEPRPEVPADAVDDGDDDQGD